VTGVQHGPENLHIPTAPALKQYPPFQPSMIGKLVVVAIAPRPKDGPALITDTLVGRLAWFHHRGIDQGTGGARYLFFGLEHRVDECLIELDKQHYSVTVQPTRH
jgi:hypothetical protein